MPLSRQVSLPEVAIRPRPTANPFPLVTPWIPLHPCVCCGKQSPTESRNPQAEGVFSLNQDRTQRSTHSDGGPSHCYSPDSPKQKGGRSRPNDPLTADHCPLNHFPFSILTTRSKSSSVPYSITIFPFPFRSRIRTLIPSTASSDRCAARTFGSTHRAPLCFPLFGVSLRNVAVHHLLFQQRHRHLLGDHHPRHFRRSGSRRPGKATNAHDCMSGLRSAAR